MTRTTFAKAARMQPTRTTNGMVAVKSTGDHCMDLFYNIGASRGKDIIPMFSAAFGQNPELAVRIALWARDARKGAGERQVFKDILKFLSENYSTYAARVVARVPELGRWDDLLVTTGTARDFSFDLIKWGLFADEAKDQRGLVAKWMPRKGTDAIALRQHLALSPKRYRKTLVENTKVVESLMCQREWSQINYSHVPSVAAARYQKAFGKHDPLGYTAYKEALKKNDGTAKINASTVYPYDVIKSVHKGDSAVALAQWEALPNYIGDANVLPVVDVSGSMTCPAGGNNSKSSLTCLDISVSLGLYCADKNKGVFKDLFLTFSSKPILQHLTGNLIQKIQQMNSSNWDMSTDLHKAFELILDTGVRHSVPQEEMPGIVLILSDMQFNQCCRYDDTAIEMIRRKYKAAGYTTPKVVFWNLNASYDNSPVTANEQGVALVSGFSPAIMKSVLANTDNFSPENVMLETVNIPRYDF